METFSETLSMYVPERTELDRLENVLERLECAPRFAGARGMLYNIVSELISNGVRANLKRVFFQGHGYDSGNYESYCEGLRSFLRSYKNIYRDIAYRRALREKNLDIQLNFDLSPERLLLCIRNGTPLLLHEEKRIRDKLARVMDASSEFSFSGSASEEVSEEEPPREDEMEGRDLGFGIIIESIRRLGFDPELFRIFSCEGETRARLEFPLNSSYVPIRRRPFEATAQCLPA